MKRLLVLSAALALGACGNSSTSPTPGTGFRQLPSDHVMLGVRQYLTDDGVRRGLLQADTAYVFMDSAKIDLRKVHLVLYNPDGRQSADMTSKAGDVHQQTNVMVARGNVVLVANGGDQRIETQELHYDPNSHRVWSTVATTLQKNGTRVTGDGFNADDQLKNIQVTHPRGRVEGLKVTF